MRGFSRGPAPPHICPETGEEVSYYTCASRCPKHGVHTEGDLPKCIHEYERLKSEGFYARTQEEWLEHLRYTDPEKYQRLVDEEKERERVRKTIDEDYYGDTAANEFDSDTQDRDADDKSDSVDDSEEDEQKTEDDDDETDEDLDWDSDDEEEEDGWW